MTRIVGICLFRNEEYFLERAIRNVAAFCDDIILVDNESDDFSGQVAAALMKDLPHVTYVKVASPHRTQGLISHLAGTKTWVLGIDGDEVYDPEGLARLRPRILAGEFDDYFQLRGHSLHCTGLDPVSFLTANGYMTPAARPVTKLYNFAGISWWGGIAQRLHGWDIVFRDRMFYTRSRHFNQDQSWDECDLRLLHLCFLPRSRADLREPGEQQRQNPSETKRKLDYKRITYAVGDQVQVSIGPFFPPLSGMAVSPPDRVAHGLAHVVRQPLPNLKEASNAPLLSTLRDAFPPAIRFYDIAPVGMETGRHQIGRDVFVERPVITVDITPRVADLPVVVDGQEALFVEAALFREDPRTLPEPDAAAPVATTMVQISVDVLRLDQASRVELPVDARLMNGSAGFAAIDLVVPRALRFRRRLAERLVVPLPASGAMPPPRCDMA